jgi:hypothetical protein
MLAACRPDDECDAARGTGASQGEWPVSGGYITLRSASGIRAMSRVP